MSELVFLIKYWIFLSFLLLLFILKLYINYRLSEYSLLRDTNQILEHNIFFSFNFLGDNLILLCIIVLGISWVFLSERFLSTNIHSILYFFIFIVLTINMVYSDNLIVMFVFFEFIFLPSLYFVYMLGYAKKVEKTIKYLLVWTLTGSFIVLCSIIYLYGIIGCLDLSYLSLIKFTNFEKITLYMCFFIGFGIKIPLWPFHYWLTKVHVEAPTGFSIFLSGYLVKTALFCLIYFINIFKLSFLVYMSSAWIIWGSIDASIRMWSATDIKRLIAFATIQEMNLILIYVLLTSNTYYKLLNTFILVHGLLSALLFFLIDQIQKRYQTRNLCNLSGLAYKLTILPIVIWVSILIFRGFPIFSKFLIEWEILTIFYENYSVFGVVLFIIIGVFGVLGFCRIWFIILYGQPSLNLFTSVDLLKSDKYIAIYIISLLFFLGFFIFLFND